MSVCLCVCVSVCLFVYAITSSLCSPPLSSLSLLVPFSHPLLSPSHLILFSFPLISPSSLPLISPSHLSHFSPSSVPFSSLPFSSLSLISPSSHLSLYLLSLSSYPFSSHPLLSLILAPIEYGRAEVAITTTYLSYFYDGLTRSQILDAFKHLLDLDSVIEKEALYNEWVAHFHTVPPYPYAEEHGDIAMAMPTTTQPLLPPPPPPVAPLLPLNTSCLDLTNDTQVDKLHTAFTRNMEVVCFYLDKVVFPRETPQFSGKYVATPCDLCYTDELVGFSGTNDSKVTLPLGVIQHSLPMLSGTNGKLLHILTSPTLGNTHFKVLASPSDTNSSEDTPLWRQIVGETLRGGAHAILDSGALMIGASSQKVVETVLAESPVTSGGGHRDFLGGIFAREDGRLLSRGLSGRDSLVENAPVRPAQCFVFLDDARCRGTDLKLDPAAHAYVTLGKDLTRDKLVQTAMRLRQLGEGQTVTFLGTKEVEMSIRRAVGAASKPSTTLYEGEEINSLHIFLWALANSAAASERAIMEMVKQCCVFNKRCEVPAMLLRLAQEPLAARALVFSLCKEKEMTSPKDLYGGVLAESKCALVAKAHVHHTKMALETTLNPFTCQEASEHLKEVAGVVIANMDRDARILDEHAKEYVYEIQMASSSLDEEYEVCMSEKALHPVHARTHPFLPLSCVISIIIHLLPLHLPNPYPFTPSLNFSYLLSSFSSSP